MRLVGERGAQFKSRIEYLKNEILESIDYESERWHEQHDNFLNPDEGRDWMEREAGDDVETALESYYESDDYQEWYSDKIHNLDIAQLGGMDNIVDKHTQYSDLDEFVEDTLQQVLPEMILDGGGFSQIKDFQDFEFEIGMTVNMDMVSQDQARPAASVLNNVVRYVKEAQSAIDVKFQYDTAQLNLFTGEVDLVDLGSAVRVTPNVRVCMQELIDVAVAPRAEMSPDYGQIADLLVSDIVTEYRYFVVKRRHLSMPIERSVHPRHRVFAHTGRFRLYSLLRERRNSHSVCTKRAVYNRSVSP